MKHLVWLCIKCKKAYEIQECSNCAREANGNLLYVDIHEMGGTSLVCKTCGYAIRSFTCSCGAVNKFSPERQIEIALSNLVIHRASHFSGMASAIDIFIDGELVANIRNGETKTIRVGSGEKVIKAKMLLNPAREITIDFKDGHQYNVEVRMGMTGLFIKEKP